MTVLAIDPGSEQSAYVVWDGAAVLTHGKVPNAKMLSHLRYDDDMPQTIVIEWIASYGMPVGAEVFDTARIVGRFQQLAEQRKYTKVHLMVRQAVKLHICRSVKAKDANIRAAILDRFGGKPQAIGVKANPGPLYGLKADEWQALALAITWFDQHAPQAPGAVDPHADSTGTPTPRETKASMQARTQGEP